MFIRIDYVATSQQRVGMRVMQGGHDVPNEKLVARFGRTPANQKRAIQSLPIVIVFDTMDLAQPYRLEAIYRHGARIGTG